MVTMRSSFISTTLLVLASTAWTGVFSWQSAAPISIKNHRPMPISRQTHAVRSYTTSLNSQQTQEPKTEPSIEDTTEKYGLEAGLFQSLRQKEGGAESAKSLLAKYGVAYLATSIPLAIVSFALCYILVDNGVDVAALLAKVGIQGGDTTDKVGTAAIAYAAHKAASPIRFPPTVLLTPVVAKIIGKEPEDVVEDGA